MKTFDEIMLSVLAAEMLIKNVPSPSPNIEHALRLLSRAKREYLKLKQLEDLEEDV